MRQSIAPLRLALPFALSLAGVLSLAGALGTVSGAKADQSAALAATMKIAPNLSSFTLDNGLEVVVIPDHRAPVVTHMIWYKAGAADEPAGQSGVAHFLEHLMFKGTSTHPNGAFSKAIAEIGGQENAFTSNDYTAYFQRVAKEHLGLMMEMEADRMENLVLNEEIIAPEREVVLEERRSRVDRNPGSRLRETLNAVTYVNHPYGSPVIGWESEIRALNTEAAIAFYDRFYTPNNAILIVAGDVEAKDVRALAEKTYGQVARRAEPGMRVRPAEPPVPGERSVTLRDERVRQESVSKTWIVPSQTTGSGLEPEALDLLAYILGGGSTSRLHKSLVLDEKLALSAGSYYMSTSLDTSRFGVYATPAEGVAITDMEAAIRSEIADIAENGISAEELKRSKHRMLAEALYAQDSQTSLARIFGSALTSGQSVEDIQTWPAQIQAVTAEDVRKAAETYLNGPPVTGYLKKPLAATAAKANGKS